MAEIGTNTEETVAYAGFLSREGILFTFPRDIVTKGSHVMEDMLKSQELMESMGFTEATRKIPVVNVDGNGTCVQCSMSTMVYKNEYPLRKPIEPPIRTLERFISPEQKPEAVAFARTYAT
ncbi:MAG: hypothetical protein ACOVQN_02840 [Exiguobacterium sp.]